MNAARVNAAARVVQAALEQGKRTSAGLAIALESAGLLNAPEVTELLALSEQQIEVLAAAGHRVANDANHEHQCMCDAWPERCVSTGNYYMGAWDVSGLEDALPAVLALWEQMRGGEILRLQARVDELEAERHSTNESLSTAAEALRVQRDRIAELETAPTAVYRAEHPDSGITLGHYGTEDAARAHCEATERRSWPTGTSLSFDWTRDALPEDDEHGIAELVVTAGQNEESTTGYIVTALQLASEYDEGADE